MFKCTCVYGSNELKKNIIREKPKKDMENVRSENIALNHVFLKGEVSNVKAC